MVGREDRAAGDLEDAYKIVGAELIPDLIDGLERWRAAAGKRDDRAGERAATLRLVDILGKEGAAEQARHTLAGWVERAPDDTEALRTLMAMDTEGGRWETVIETCTKLVAMLLDALRAGSDAMRSAARLRDEFIAEIKAAASLATDGDAVAAGVRASVGLAIVNAALVKMGQKPLAPLSAAEGE